MPGPNLTIDIVVSAPFMENTLVVHQGGRSDCVIIDPGFQPDKIVTVLQRRNLEPAAILLTHGHADHIAGNAFLKQRWPQLPLIIGAGDAEMLVDPIANLSGLAEVAVVSPPADRLVREGDVVDAAGLRFLVRDVPGHSPGHVVYIVGDATPQVVFGGDVLFAGSVGRTDFPGGSGPQLIQGIREKLFPLPPDTIVYPGHGPATTIGEEMRSNPFCRSAFPG